MEGRRRSAMRKREMLWLGAACELKCDCMPLTQQKEECLFASRKITGGTRGKVVFEPPGGRPPLCVG